MTYLPSLPPNGALLEIFKAYPQSAIPLIDFHEVLLRGESPFTIAERELIAAYVSGLNACNYCHGIHTVTAQQFGIAEKCDDRTDERCRYFFHHRKDETNSELHQKTDRNPSKNHRREDAQTIFAVWLE